MLIEVFIFLSLCFSFTPLLSPNKPAWALSSESVGATLNHLEHYCVPYYQIGQLGSFGPGLAMLTGRLLSLVSLPTHPALILMLIMAALPTSIYWISLFLGLKAPFSWELPVHTESAFATWMYRENWIQCQIYSY